ncbi:DMT family transporter [Bacillus taeanensis]|uniref:EamA family transporter n=1 Tax=Bacillus taeanensis TaxID=273032 RepID=A0A366XUV1_9BACI|nr:EamA family transporter [Bacillus taeanensis]RBW67913.1 EamA family transporter [Bacillus taeanensis]
MVVVSFLFMCFIFGTTFLAIKIGVDSGLPPFLSAGFRFFVSGLILFTIMVCNKKTTKRLLIQKEMLLTGGCLTFGTFSTLYWAEQYVTSGVAAVLSSTGPMMILIIQSIFLKQKGNRLSFIGCFIGMIGVSFLLFPSLTIKTSSFWLYGCLVIIIGEVFYAAGTIYTKQVMNRFQNTSPIALNAVQMMYGGILLIVLSFVTERGQFDINMNPASIGSLVYLIVFGSMIGHSLYYWLVVRTNPVFPSTWLFISPIIALLLGVIFYEEAISWLTALGALTIITGTILVNFQSIRGLDKKKLIFTRALKS